ncbi:MAG TPA: DUF1697 domain-containing protein [Nocardioidaceae bacterium]|nr:DUF1697 domain-containing protein [Nocardioidaceae bacterium]
MRWVGLVRNVMLGREGLHREVLLDGFRAAGATDVRNHLTTGNVTFSADEAEAVGLQAEAAIAEVIGRHEPVILRDLAWLQDFLDDNPFGPYVEGGRELEVGFLPLHVDVLDASALPDPEPTIVVHVGEREVATARPRQGNRRPHVVPLLETFTGVKATARSLSTLEKIVGHGS